MTDLIDLAPQAAVAIAIIAAALIVVRTIVALAVKLRHNNAKGRSIPPTKRTAKEGKGTYLPDAETLEQLTEFAKVMKERGGARSVVPPSSNGCPPRDECLKRFDEIGKELIDQHQTLQAHTIVLDSIYNELTEPNDD